jgi:hypothetical protein
MLLKLLPTVSSFGVNVTEIGTVTAFSGKKTEVLSSSDFKIAPLGLMKRLVDGNRQVVAGGVVLGQVVTISAALSSKSLITS